MIYKPQAGGGAFFWTEFEGPPGHARYGEPAPQKLPVCYFSRLKGGIAWPRPFPARQYDTEAEAMADLEQAQAKLEEDTRGLGTPLSQLSGRPGTPGYAEFCRIAESWGYP